jgi:serine protease Do
LAKQKHKKFKPFVFEFGDLMKKLFLLSTLVFASAIPHLAHAKEDFNPNIFVELAKKVVPSVVNIQTVSKGRRSFSRGAPEDLFRKYFEDFFRNGGGGGRHAPPEEDEGGGGGNVPEGMALGTGFIIDSSGLILTNNHVVADADEIKIIFTEDAEEKPTEAKVVGRDADLDLALIKGETTRKLVPASLGDSDALQVGEYVLAVGNPFGQGHSVTHGIISAKGRKSPDFALASYLQTDAPINPGNSGGPLLNLKGEVIGINNAIDARAQGIGFAIPINFAKSVLPQLKTKGSVSRGYIGIQVNDLTPEIANRVEAPKEVQGCFVAHVYPGDPADKAGIRPYDIITDFGTKKVKSANDLILAVTATSVGDSIPITVIRSGKNKELKIKIALRPNSKPDDRRRPKAEKKEELGRKLSGLEVEDLTPETAKELGVPENTKGVVVSDIRFEGPADKSGLARGDVIVEVDRKAVKSEEDFYHFLKTKKSYLLRVLRVDEAGQQNFQVLVLDLK